MSQINMGSVYAYDEQLEQPRIYAALHGIPTSLFIWMYESNRDDPLRDDEELVLQVCEKGDLKLFDYFENIVKVECIHPMNESLVLHALLSHYDKTLAVKLLEKGWKLPCESTWKNFLLEEGYVYMEIPTKIKQIPLKLNIMLVLDQLPVELRKLVCVHLF